MKKLSVYIIGILIAFFVACGTEFTKMDDGAIKNTTEIGKNALVDPYNFANVPEEVVRKAQEVYGHDELPPVTIAFSYSGGDNNIILEEGWTYSFWKTPGQGCEVGENSDYSDGRGMLKTIDGFTFLEQEDLCGFGTSGIDNRQGGWFDYVCGPNDISFDYQGNAVFVYVHLWCE